jgi:hypothetical protein
MSVHGCEHLHTHNSFLLPRWRSNCSFRTPNPGAGWTSFFVGTEKLASNQVVLFKGKRITEVAVLPALQQTEDYLVAHPETTIGATAEAVSAAPRHFDNAFARYRTGVDTYLNVFSAHPSLLSDQQSTVSVRIQQLTSPSTSSRRSAAGGIQPGLHLKKRRLQRRM